MLDQRLSGRSWTAISLNPRYGDGDGKALSPSPLSTSIKLWLSPSPISMIVQICPEDFGLSRFPLERVCGGDATENSVLLTSLLNGEHEALESFVVLNAAAALFVAGRAHDYRHGVAIAREAFRNGDVRARLDDYIRYLCCRDVLSVYSAS